MAQGQDWNAIGVLNFNKSAIAVINPYTMVAAARDYTSIESIRKLAREVASSWIEEREVLGFPLLSSSN